MTPSQPRQFGPGTVDREDFLQCRSEFSRVRAEGSTERGQLMILNSLAAPDERSRLGIIVSKRYDKRAVHRNRARRLIRESFRLIRHRISSPVWIVVIARGRMRNQKCQAVQEEMLRLLSRSELISHEGI